MRDDSHLFYTAFVWTTFPSLKYVSGGRFPGNGAPSPVFFIQPNKRTSCTRGLIPGIAQVCEFAVRADVHIPTNYSIFFFKLSLFEGRSSSRNSCVALRYCVMNFLAEMQDQTSLTSCFVGISVRYTKRPGSAARRIAISH